MLSSFIIYLTYFIFRSGMSTV